jgi:hypothetical protein
VHAPDLDAGVALDVGDGAYQRVAVEGIAVQRLGVQDERPPLGFVTGQRSTPCGFWCSRSVAAEARCEDDLQQLSYNRHMLAASLEPNVITIPYLARPHFRPFHASTKRFRYIVSHRRAGKSVALIVHMIIQCINNKRQQPPPKYAYVAPSFAAAKDLV